MRQQGGGGGAFRSQRIYIICCGVTYFANIFTKTNLSAKPFKSVCQGEVGFNSGKKMPKNLVTLPLKVSLDYTVLYTSIV